MSPFLLEAGQVATLAALVTALSSNPPEAESGTFDKAAAKTALDEAAAQARNCKRNGEPTGHGRVRVRYEPSGAVSAVTLVTTKFENTTTGSCVKMVFQRARVPAFTGAPSVLVLKEFEIAE